MYRCWLNVSGFKCSILYWVPCTLVFSFIFICSIILKRMIWSTKLNLCVIRNQYLWNWEDWWSEFGSLYIDYIVYKPTCIASVVLGVLLALTVTLLGWGHKLCNQVIPVNTLPPKQANLPHLEISKSNSVHQCKFIGEIKLKYNNEM